MDYIFAKNPDVKGIYGTSGNAVMTAVEQSARLEKDVKIVGFDATEEEVQALQDGSIYGLVAQNPYGMGYAAIVQAPVLFWIWEMKRKSIPDTSG